MSKRIPLEAFRIDNPDEDSDRTINSIHAAIHDSGITGDEENPFDSHIHGKPSEEQIKRKELIKELNFSKKDYIYEKIIPERISDNSFNNKIEIKHSMYNLEDILIAYESQGFRISKKDISPEYNISISEFKTLEAEKAQPAKFEVTRQGLPEEYRPLLAVLAKQHPGIRYKEMTCLEDQSQHNVDILTFEYEENGEKKQLHVVAKDANEAEEKLPCFLNDLGIKTHSIYDVRTRLHMQHIGEKELKEVVRKASEPELLRVCSLALDKMAQIHVVGSAHLPELRHDYGLVFGPADYTERFKSRFIEPVSGNSAVISPQADRLMQAYSAFIELFEPGYLIHGDFHTGNCRVTSDNCFVYDFEWTTDQGEKFRDLSRFVNSVLRDRPDLEPADFTREMLARYVERHNAYSEREKTAFMRHDAHLSAALRCALIDDQIDKTGGAVLFAQSHPKVKEEQMQKCQLYFENAVRMLDGAIRSADEQKDYFRWEALSDLRSALVNFTANSPVHILKEAAQNYQTHALYREPAVLVPN